MADPWSNDQNNNLKDSTWQSITDQLGLLGRRCSVPILKYVMNRPYLNPNLICQT